MIYLERENHLKIITLGFGLFYACWIALLGIMKKALQLK